MGYPLISSFLVLFMSHHFKMSFINTTPIIAQVVYLFLSGDESIFVHPHDYMYSNSLSRKRHTRITTSTSRSRITTLSFMTRGRYTVDFKSTMYNFDIAYHFVEYFSTTAHCYFSFIEPKKNPPLLE